MGDDAVGADHPRAQRLQAFPRDTAAEPRRQHGEAIADDTRNRLHRDQRQTGLGIAQAAGLERGDGGAVEAIAGGARGGHFVGATVARLQQRVDVQHGTGAGGKADAAAGRLCGFARLVQTQCGDPFQGRLIGLSGRICSAIQSR